MHFFIKVFHLTNTLSTNKITDESQIEIPPFHSCTISYIPTLVFLSFLWYVFYGGGHTHTQTGISGNEKRKENRERGGKEGSCT